MQITEIGIQKIASIRVINRTISMVNTVVRSTSEIFKPMRSGSQRNMAKSGESAPQNVGAVPDDNYRISHETTVRFSDAPYVAGEGTPPPQIKRNESLSRVTSALRNSMHKRALSGDRAIAQAQEIPYTELDEMSQPSSSSDSITTNNTNNNNNNNENNNDKPNNSSQE
jgi:hypothetical protein